MSKRKNRQFNYLQKEKKKRQKEIFRWEDLVTSKDEVIKSALDQQKLLLELVEQHKEIIDNNEELQQQVKGLMLSYKDICDDTVRSVSIDHIKPGTSIEDNPIQYRTGIVEVEDEEYFDYVNIAFKYVTKLEQLGNISQNGFIDIYLKISELNPEVAIPKEVEQFKKDMEKEAGDTSYLKDAIQKGQELAERNYNLSKAKKKENAIIDTIENLKQ